MEKKEIIIGNIRWVFYPIFGWIPFDNKWYEEQKSEQKWIK